MDSADRGMGPQSGVNGNIDRTEWIAKSAQDLPEAIHTQITVEKGQPILDGIWHQFSGDEFNDIVMNELAMKAGDTNIPAEASSYRWKNKNKVWYREDGVYVCAHKTAAGDGMDPPYEDPITVTVYAQDGDKRVDLGEKEFRVTDLNDPNGRKRSVPAIPGDVDYDLNVVPYDGEALRGLKPGVYTLLADTSATVANDVTTSEVGTLTVLGIKSITIEPDPATVKKGEGGTQQMKANVETIGDNIDQSVTWAVSGNQSSGTTIDKNTGLLTVAADETADNFTVTATSVFDNGGMGTVSGAGEVAQQSITGVTVSPANAQVEIGGTQQFDAVVTAVNNAPETVTWMVLGGKVSTIDANGLLTVSKEEVVGSTLTVRATSDFDQTKQAEAKVVVVDPDGKKYMPDDPVKGTIEPGKDLTMTFPGNPKDVTGAKMNGKAFTLKGMGTDTIEGYTAEGLHAFTGVKGSVDVTLYREYLDTLPNGDYAFTLQFADGSGTVSFIIARPDLVYIQAAAGPNGTISSSGNVGVGNGDSYTFYFTPDAGYRTDKVVVDGKTVKTDGKTYTFRQVREPHTISVTFARGAAGALTRRSDVPKTGDGANLALWAALAALGGGLLLAAAVLRKKRGASSK